MFGTKRVFIFLCIFLSSNFSLIGQETLNELTLTLFLQQVKENHPVALVANNQLEMARQFLRQSKGGFDPVAFSGIEQKFYDGKTYYTTLTSGIKIPTLLGIDFKVAGDWNNGVYLNDQERVPDGGLSYVGFEAQLGRGMFTDERRTQLRRAEVAVQQSVFQQQVSLNDLLYDAGQQFIQLQEQTAQLKLAEEGYRLAKVRYEQIKLEANIGERAFLDTIEASAQLYLRFIDLQQRQMMEQNARYGTEVYLWEKGVLPLRLDTLLPIEPLKFAAAQGALNLDISQNPNLLLYGTKLSDLKLERRLKREQLKPQLNVNYNMLQTPKDLIAFNYSFANYKWGASFYMPLLLRKERSALQLTELKLENTQFEQQLKRRELELKLLQNRQNWFTTLNQSQTSLLVAERYAQLADAERNFFAIGESNLFLLNAREMSYLSAQSKYLEFLGKASKFQLSDKYIKGELGN